MLDLFDDTQTETREDYAARGYVWLDGLLYRPPEPLKSSGRCGPGGRCTYEYLTGESLPRMVNLLRDIAEGECVFAVDFETSCSKTAPVDPETGEFDLSRLNWSLRDKENGSEPHTSVVFLMAVSTEPDHSYVVDVREALGEPGFREALGEACASGNPIAHNFGFEWQFLLALTGREARCYFDPMIGTQMLYAGLPDPDVPWTDPDKPRPRVSAALSAVLKREMGLTLDKSTRADFLRLHPDSGLTDEHVAYVAGDTGLLIELSGLLIAKLKAKEVWHVWRDLEAPFLPILCRIRYEGVCVDVPKIVEYWKEAKAKLAEIEAEWQARFPAIPIRSQPSILGWLHTKYPHDGIHQATKEVLAELELAYPDDRDLGILLRFRKVSVVEGTFLRAWVMSNRHPLTGRIHTSFQQTFTDTGRISSKQPKRHWAFAV